MLPELLSVFGGNGGGVFVGIIMAVLAFLLVLIILMIVSLWKIFTKAGQPGWAAIIPFYGNYVLVQVARLPVYYFIIMVVPSLLVIVNIKIPSPVDSFVGIITFIVYGFTMYNVSKQFGKGIEYTLGMIFLPFIFYPMLAFGGAVYQQEQVSYDHEPSEILPGNNVPTESPVVTAVNKTPVTEVQQKVE